MNPNPVFARNAEMFGEFHHLQLRLTGRLAHHPNLIRRWLDAQPTRMGEPSESAEASKSWRTARLSVARRRELVDLIGRVEAAPEDAPLLAAWLAAAVPVRTYLAIADCAEPDLETVDGEAGELRGQLVELREALFNANYGLARATAGYRGERDLSERQSAASCGLLDAIDRYVPGERAARFSYFANYWIRYQLGRYLQKNGSLVSYPINQHRISKKIERYIAGRRSAGGPQPTAGELCAALQIGPDAYYWHRCRPQVTSLQEPLGGDSDSLTMEHTLRDPAPEPAAVVDQNDTACHLRMLLRAHTAPSVRIMLAYTRGVGALTEAAEDFLAQLHELSRTRIRAQAERIRMRERD